MNEIPIARPSATVVLAREARGAPELLMMRRHERSSFGGAYAFPGGVLEAADHRVASHCRGVTPDEAAQLLGDKNGLDYFSAAIRELFEESGVLLADIDESDLDLNAARAALNSGTLDWSEFVATNGLNLLCDELRYFSFWITPEALPRRYSTRFFVAAMPDNQEALHCGGELTESHWATAADALKAERAGTISMHFPTIKTLESLAAHRSLQALLEWADDCSRRGVPCIFPKIGSRDGERRVVIKGRDAGALK